MMVDDLDAPSRYLITRSSYHVSNWLFLATTCDGDYLATSVFAVSITPSPNAALVAPASI